MLNETLIIYKRELCLTKFPESQFMAHVYPKLGVYTPKRGAYKGVMSHRLISLLSFLAY